MNAARTADGLELARVMEERLAELRARAADLGPRLTPRQRLDELRLTGAWLWPRRASARVVRAVRSGLRQLRSFARGGSRARRPRARRQRSSARGSPSSSGSDDDLAAARLAAAARISLSNAASVLAMFRAEGMLR
jgi:hypothetical protein